MQWSFLLLDLLPALVFVVVESLGNLRWALLATLGSAVFALGYSLYSFGEIDELTVISSGIVVLFGWLALHFDDGVYFKLKPAIINTVMAAVFLVTYSQGSPLMITAAERYGGMLPQPFQQALSLPEVRATLERMSLYLGFGLIAHAAVVAWAALRLRSWWWFAARGAGFYAMVFVVAYMAR